MIDIYLKDGMAFVEFNEGYLLCIGTKADVDAATPARILEMIQEAVTISRFMSITSSQRQMLH